MTLPSLFRNVAPPNATRPPPWRPEQGGFFNMPDNEDSIGSWLMAIALGVGIAAAIVAWPVIAWKIAVCVFK